MNTLSLFDNIKVNNSDRISASDRKRIDEITAEFHKCLNRLYDWADIFRKHIQDNPDDAVEVRYSRVNLKDDQKPYHYLSGNCPDSVMFAETTFHPLYCLERIGLLMAKACLRYEGMIVGHFHRTYNCDFENKDVIRNGMFGDIFEYNSNKPDWNKLGSENLLPIPEDRRLPDAEPIIDYVIFHLGGMDFKTKARQETIEKFLKEFRYCNPELKKDTLIFHGCLWAESWTPESLTYDSRKKLQLLMDTVNIVSGKETSAAISDFNERFVDFGSPYDVLFSSMTALTIYKNRNLKVRFESAEAAKTFFDTTFGSQPNDK